MDQHHAGERLDLQYSNETTTPATTAELLKLIHVIISHPSTKAAPMTSVISLLLARIATTVKAIEQKNNTLKTETKNTGAK
jgi:hypothetical protein